MELIDIYKCFEKKENFEHGQAQTEAQINVLEDKLKIKFPEAYKELLRKYGYISFFGTEIYGPSNDPYCDLLTRNKKARDQKLPKDFIPLPLDAFIFMQYGGGGYYMLFSEDSPRAGQVGLFLSETAYHEEQTWEGFKAFLEDYFCI